MLPFWPCSGQGAGRRNIDRKLPSVLSIPALLLAAVVLACAGLLLQPPAQGSAHAVIVKTDPAAFSTLIAPPTRVTVWASEPLNPRFSSLQVFDAQQQRIDAQNSRVSSQDPHQMDVDLLPIKEGTYTVLWVTNSAFDGHTLRGSYLFAVSLSGKPVFPSDSQTQGQAPSAAATGAQWSSALVVQTVAQWSMLAIALLLVGGLLFRLGVPGLLDDKERKVWAAIAIGRGGVRWAAVERFLAISLPVNALLAVLALVANASGSWRTVTSPSFLWSFIGGSPLGVATLVKMVASLAVLGICLLTLQKGVWAMLAGGLVFLASEAFTGHAAAVDQPLFLPVIMDWVHMVAASAWFGGMGSVVVALLPQKDGQRERFPDWQRVLGVLDGFSPIALVAAALLVATGAYNSVTRLSSPSDLLWTDYGRVLLAKIVAVVVLVALGYLNVYVTRPRLKVAIKKDLRGRRTLASRLRRLLVWEPAVAVIIIAVTALLAVYPPPGLVATARSKVGTPATPLPVLPATPKLAIATTRFSLAQRTDDLLIVVKVGPANVGKNQVSASISLASGGGKLSGPVLVRFRTTYLDQESGSQFITTEQQPDGSYVGEADFTFKGNWKLEVIVRRQDKLDVTSIFSFPVPAVDATSLLQRTEKAMDGLRSAAQHEELDTGSGGQPQVTDAEFVAPDSVHFRSATGSEYLIVGTKQFLKEPNKTWQKSPVPSTTPYVWPNFSFAKGWVQPVLLGSETVDGQQQSLVAAFDSNTGLYYVLWISANDNLVRRWQHFGPGHFIDDRFSGFNSTTIPVQPSELPQS